MQRPDDEVRTMELRVFLDIVRRRARFITLITLGVISVSVALTTVSDSRYTSTAEVEVQPLTVERQLEGDASIEFVNMDTQAASVTQSSVVEGTLLRLGEGRPDDATLSAALEQAAEDVAATVQPNTTYLEVACTKGSPDEATACAQAFAEAYVDHRVDMAEELTAEQTGPGALTANPEAAVLSRPADLPDEPSNKSYLLAVAIGTVLGLLLGIGAALLRERLAEPVTDRETFAEALVAPVLAVVPDAMPARSGAKLGPESLSKPGTAGSEAYRIARTTLQHLSRGGRVKVLAVAGLDGGADATRTTAELALALAQGGRRVAAVSANLRTPTLNRLLGVGSSIGLASVLTGEADLEEALLPTSTPGLQVIASGLTTDLPPELLDTDEMRGVVNELRSAFDFLLLDTAPQPWAADTLSLVPLTDGIIVTVVAGRTLREDVRQLRHLVEGVGGQIVGGILKQRPQRGSRGARPAGTTGDDRVAPHQDDRSNPERLVPPRGGGGGDSDVSRRISDIAG